MAAKKQFVNMPATKKEYGRFFPLTVNIRETKPGESEGMLLYLFMEPDGANVPAEQLSLADRNGGFCFIPQHRELVQVKDKKAMSHVFLSIGGGDKFKFKAGRKADKSGAVDAHVEVEVWRRIYVQMGYMKVGSNPPHRWANAPVANMGTVTSSLQDNFIELATQGPRSVPHVPWINNQNPISQLAAKVGKPKYPDQTTQMVFVDRIGKKSTVNWGPWTFTRDALKAGLVRQSELPAGQFTWPDDADWGTCQIEVLDDAGVVRRSMRTPAGFMTKEASGAYQHPEGKAARKVNFDFGTLAGMGAWLRFGTGSVRLTVVVKIIDDEAMGLAWPSPPRILIATRSPTRYTRNDKLENTVVHEIGHVLGLNVKNLPKYNVDHGYLDSWEDNPTWYNNVNGGVGSHCHTGATLDANNKYKNGTCAMLHYVNGKTAYCPDCKKVLKRSDLKKLGRTAIWPRG